VTYRDSYKAWLPHCATTDEEIRRVSELIGKASLSTFLKVSGACFGGPKVHTPKVAAAYSFLFVQLQSTSISRKYLNKARCVCAKSPLTNVPCRRHVSPTEVRQKLSNAYLLPLWYFCTQRHHEEARLPINRNSGNPVV
jgi:hypothetical protein